MARRPNWYNRLTPAFRRPRFFSIYEWWYHLLMMPVLFPIGNYYFIGPRYVSSPVVFVLGTTIVFCLYWLSIGILTVTVRYIIRRFPAAHQTATRMLIMLLATAALTVVLAVVDVWVYSLVPVMGVHFSWATVKPIWVLGFVFDVFLCMALGLGYTYTQWYKDLWEEEKMQQELLQRQFDSLKGQLNPHFLFNSLDSLLALIKNDPKRAEVFVDKLAFVYRYMMQPDRRVDPTAIVEPGEVVTLRAELDFMDAYVELLQVRYGHCLQLKRPDHTSNSLLMAYSLPPLSVQILIDHAIQHSGIALGRPLFIAVELTDDGWLLVSSNRNASRTTTADPDQLEELSVRCRYLSEKALVVETTETGSRVGLPLLMTRDFAPD